MTMEEKLALIKDEIANGENCDFIGIYENKDFFEFYHQQYMQSDCKSRDSAYIAAKKRDIRTFGPDGDCPRAMFIGSKFINDLMKEVLLELKIYKWNPEKVHIQKYICEY